MLSIGALAQIGQVTHRMLRHWDSAGLLVPAQVDPFTGYRSYDPSQLERLHRIVALRQLGFGLDDIALILNRGIDAERLAGLLRARRAEVTDKHRLAEARLRDVERRLRLIDQENTVSTLEIVQKSLPTLRLAALTTVLTEQDEIPAVIGPMYGRIVPVLIDAGATLGPAIAQYDMSEDGMRLIAGFEYAGDVPSGLEDVVLPEVATAFCGVHLGAMDTIFESWQSLHGEIVARGYTPNGPIRELYLRSEPAPQSDWVTELQQPVAPV
ncbi:MAG TPA: MerR family transcriptional regulator [Candidatus Brachybacterium merdavium]|uniref:MerR family transcriptional regulator n=1 Tax=Candidatus Brachybacterium merdavium TaxID=2838513 RepID=A0A9D2LBF7_9MICO|nr:MerR family transcriptional regulator [Candidatus Brachybacterium merdavium]